MPRLRFDLGAGIIGAPGIDLVWAGIADLVDVVEVEPQAFAERHEDGEVVLNAEALEWLVDRGRPVICHGVGAPVGGLIGPDAATLEVAALAAEQLGARHWSEHLSLNRARSNNGRLVESGFLLPPHHSWAAVEAAVEHVGCYQRRLDLPFLVETPANYLAATNDELSDGDFVAEVVLRSDCGILLDLHNVWANERNGRQPVSDFVERLPLERVLEVHLAGGFELDGYYLDAHVGAVASELLALAASIIPRLPNVRAVVFEALPESLVFLGARGLRPVLEGLHRLVDLQPVARRRSGNVATESHGTNGAPSLTASELDRAREVDCTSARPAPPDQIDRAATDRWERELVTCTTRSGPAEAGDPGRALLALLTDQARLSRVAISEPEAVERLFADPAVAAGAAARYLTARPAHTWSADEGREFIDWLNCEAGEANVGAPAPAGAQSKEPIDAEPLPDRGRQSHLRLPLAVTS